MKHKFSIIIIFVFILALIFFNYYTQNIHKNEYIKDMKKLVKYFNKGKYNYTIITLSKNEDNITRKDLIAFSYTDNPDKFMDSLKMLSFVASNCKKEKRISELFKKSFSIRYVAQIDLDYDTKLYKLKIFFSPDFNFFGIPLNYMQEKMSSPAIAFYKIENDEITELVKDIFKK